MLIFNTHFCRNVEKSKNSKNHEMLVMIRSVKSIRIQPNIKLAKNGKHSKNSFLLKYIFSHDLLCFCCLLPEEPMKKQELADQAKTEAARKEAETAKKDTEAVPQKDPTAISPGPIAIIYRGSIMSPLIAIAVANTDYQMCTHV